MRFTARIDKRTSKAQEKIDKLTIFTPTPGMAERTIGVERVSEHPKANEAGRAATPATGPGPAAAAETEIVEDGSAGSPSAKRHVPGKGPDKSAPDVATYEVCGQVVTYRNGRLVVAVKNRFFRPKISVEVSDNAQIDVELGILTVVKPGDRIAAAGGFITRGTCEAFDVLVALANPLAPPDTHPHRTRPGAHGSNATRRPGGKSKVDAGALAGNNPAATAPAKEAVEVEDPFKDQDNPPGQTKPETKAEPVPATEVTPPAEETKPAAKKPEKKPSATDDEKDVFEK